MVRSALVKIEINAEADKNGFPLSIVITTESLI